METRPPHRQLLLGLLLAAAILLTANCDTGSCQGNARGHDACAYVTVIDLAGIWRLVNSNGSIDIDARVPGNMYTALMEEGIIGDPYYRFNDMEYRWVHWDSWTYHTHFTVGEDLTDKKAVRLVCDGLDTVATLRLNGNVIGTSDNQFVRYVYDIAEYIQVGENELVVSFRSAPEYAQEEFDQHPYVIPPECPPASYKPECHANMIRKSQCSFSWDWGPAFATQGIWQDIYIEAFDSVAIRDVVPLPSKDDGTWTMQVTVFLDVSGTDDEVSGTLTAAILELGVEQQIHVTLESGLESVGVELLAPNAEAWWPRGYGSPKLYDLDVTFVSDDTQEVTSKTARTGFRTVELIEEEMSTGLTFYFKINDVDVFMKGSNWVPLDSFMDRVSYDRTLRLLQTATDVNMNTIRIWGGGIYKFQEFYDIADELGLLIWQDTMFACSMYPVHQPFLDTVTAEITHQIRRLSRHPAVFAWTANNENEGALVDDWYGTSGELYDQYKDDYVTLYIDVIRDVILREDNSRPFLPSSPTNGKVTEMNDWISEDPRPSSPDYGDVHYFNYFLDCLDPNIYPTTRFASEFGYQSWPSFHTIKTVSVEEDWKHGSEFFFHRQHKVDAAIGMEMLIRRHFHWPDSGDELQDFKDFIYLSQVMQSLCYKVESEVYRRGRNDTDRHTMGALYWQHNDIWQAPSWSTIDFHGSWKMAHYYARHFFADPIVSFLEETGTLHLYTVSDLLEDITDVQLVTRLWSWDQSTSLFEWQTSVDVPAQSAVQAVQMSVNESLDEGGCQQRENCFLTAHLEKEALILTRVTPHYLVSFNEAVGMKDPNLRVTRVSQVDDVTFDVDVSGDEIAAFVWLEAVDIPGHFSDNGFLMTDRQVALQFLAAKPISEEELSDAIEVMSLMNLYTAKQSD